MRKISKHIATLFFVGYIPFAQGTLASLLAIPVYLAVKNNLPVYFSLTVFLLAVGFWAAGVAEKDFSRKDPHQIVIDEFASMLLVYLFVPFSMKALVIGFVLFRFFDVFKIPLLKKAETLPRGFGIMLDDIGAAILANLCLRAFAFFVK